jgi:hypothetical protein
LPHPAQNFAVGKFSCPQFVQASDSGVPHSMQNLLPGGTDDWQVGQFMIFSGSRNCCFLLP